MRNAGYSSNGTKEKPIGFSRCNFLAQQVTKNNGCLHTCRTNDGGSAVPLRIALFSSVGRNCRLRCCGCDTYLNNDIISKKSIKKRILKFYGGVLIMKSNQNRCWMLIYCEKQISTRCKRVQSCLFMKSRKMVGKMAGKWSGMCTGIVNGCARIVLQERCRLRAATRIVNDTRKRPDAHPTGDC